MCDNHVMYLRDTFPFESETAQYEDTKIKPNTSSILGQHTPQDYG